jgi:protein SCO1/2
MTGRRALTSSMPNAECRMPKKEGGVHLRASLHFGHCALGIGHWLVRLAVMSVVFLCSVTTFAQRPAGERPPVLRDVGIDQRLNHQAPLHLSFRDEEGRAVRLGDYFGRRPVILALVYYECPMLCTQVLNGLVSALGVLSFDAGREFDVVAVSFDPGEGPELARAKKHAYLERYRRPGAERGWHFLTGAQPAIAELTRAVGFRYVYDERRDQFAHGAAVIVLTPSGRIARYFYGIEYAPRDLRLGLVEASANRIGSIADQVLLLCYHYDPASGRYGFVALTLVRIGGVLTVAAIVGFWILERRRS